MDEGSPGSPEAEGEGGEGFISPKRAGPPIYTFLGGQKSAHVDSTLPVLFWRVSLAASSSREPDELRAA